MDCTRGRNSISDSRVIVRAPSRALALMLLAGAAAGLAPSARADPTGAQVVSGTADITRQGDVTRITTSHRTVINYNSFDIAAHETVQFIQPSRSSRVLNRVLGAGPSRIDGALLANGQVFIINPAGVIFGAGSVINAAGFVAAAANLTTRDFLDGNYNFTNISGPISAQGLISADAVYLIGQTIANHGTIVAEGGVVSLMVGDQVMLRESGSGILVRVDQDLINPEGQTINASHVEGAGIENTGEILAPGGRISLGAGDAYSIAVLNSGRIGASGGIVEIRADAGAIRNDGVISTSVASGDAGDIDIHGRSVENYGAIEATSDEGQSGSIEFTSDERTVLASGSVIDASGGAGVAHGGEVLVHSYGGDTVMQAGATLDLSGGELGGDGGSGEISAGHRLALDGELIGGAGEGYASASLLLDPLNLVIGPGGAQDSEAGDGAVGGGEGPGETWTVSASAIEAFMGDVSLEATNDLFVSESIDKTNGGLTLSAGRDLIFGDPGGSFIHDMTISAHTIDFTAGRNILDRVLLQTDINATMGNLSLTATSGSMQHGMLSVPAGETVILTQAQSRFVGAGEFGFIENPEQTNLVVNITDGFLIFGGDFGGVSGAQSILSVDATASEFIRIEDNLTLGNSGFFRAGEDVQIDGFIHAPGDLLFHGATDGTGGGIDGTLGVRFLSSGLDIQANSMSFIAGDGAGGFTDGRVDLLTNSPTFLGAGGGATRPMSFAIIQDASLVGADLPRLDQFGAPIAGMETLLASRDNAVTINTALDLDQLDLTLDSLNGSFINADLSLMALEIIGTTFLGGDVTTSGAQIYNDQVVLTENVALAGSMLEFDSTIEAAAPGAFGVSITGDTTFNDTVGSTFALSSLSIDGDLSQNGQLVRTTGDQEFLGGVMLGADSEFIALDASTIRFAMGLEGPGFDLTVQTDDGGLIALGGDVGGVGRLGDVALSTSGADGVMNIPGTATIVGEQSIEVFANSLTMGQHEKWTTLGSLLIDATTSAALGDLVTQGDMTIRSTEITLLRRESDDLLQSNGSLATDRGLDFVAGGEIDFDGMIVLGGQGGAPDPTFSTASGVNPGLEGMGFEVTTTAPGDVSLAALTRQGVVLDQRTRSGDDPPPTPDDASAELAGALPRDPRFVDFVQLEVHDVQALRALEVLGRPVRTEEARGAFVGRAVWDDLLSVPDVYPNPLQTAVTRIDIQSVLKLNEIFESIFGPPEAPQTAQVARELAASFDHYMTYMSLDQASSVDPVLFRSWLSRQPDQILTNQNIENLERLLDRLATMGLTDREFLEARERILDAIAPSGGFDLEILIEVIEAGPMARLQMQSDLAEVVPN